MQLALEPAVSAPVPRVEPLDALRGVIMVVMALDHANYFISKRHTSGEFWFTSPPRYPTDLDFITRLVTHPAAPGFFFLMGAGMALFAASRRPAGWSEGRITSYFALRGALLIALQFLVENRAWGLALPEGANYSFALYMGVLYGLGGSMVLGALLLRLSNAWLVPLGLGLIALSNVFLSDPQAGDLLNPIRALLLTAGSNGDLSVYYPALPWLGVTLLGVAFARYFLMGNAEGVQGQRLRWSAVLGILLIAAFVLLRMLNLGDPQPPAANGWVGFLNVTKYPPSPDFLLLTLGVDLVLLGALAALLNVGPIRSLLLPLQVFGRAALLFYLAHLFLYAVMGKLFAPDGTTLQAMYPLWMLGLAILLPLCWAYGKFKETRPPGSIWRLF